MNNKLKDDGLDYLFSAVLTLQTVEEFAQRIQVAKMLSEKKVYSDIVKETGASTATISRVNRSLTYGCDGYATVFSRLDQAKEG